MDLEAIWQERVNEGLSARGEGRLVATGRGFSARDGGITDDAAVAP
jgi:hypothetical protein